jgi:hypothetical protein
MSMMIIVVATKSRLISFPNIIKLLDDRKKFTNQANTIQGVCSLVVNICLPSRSPGFDSRQTQGDSFVVDNNQLYGYLEHMH